MFVFTCGIILITEVEHKLVITLAAYLVLFAFLVSELANGAAVSTVLR